MEKHLEEAIVAAPELIEDGLTLIARQAVLYGRRIDLLFRDRNGRRLLLELKWKTLVDSDIGQIITYAGALTSADQSDLRLMLVAPRVSPIVGRGLDHVGIAWKELPAAHVAKVLRQLGKLDLALQFEEILPVSIITPRKFPAGMRSQTRTRAAVSSTSPPPVYNLGTPAILAIVTAEPFEQAREELRQGKPQLNFGTDAVGVGPAFQLPIERVYFKTAGRTEIIAVAPFAGMTTENVPKQRLEGCEDENHWRYYYCFKEISMLPSPMALTELKYFSTGNNLLNSVAGSCVIHDPFTTK